MKKTYYWLLVIIGVAILSGLVVWKQKPQLGLDVQGGTRLVLRAKREQMPNATDAQWRDTMNRIANEVLPLRVRGALGVLEATINTKGTDQLVVELPGFTDPAEAQKVLISTARLEFRHLPLVKTDKDNYRRYSVQKDDKENYLNIIDSQPEADPVTGEKFVVISPVGKTKAKYDELVTSNEFAPLVVTGEFLKPTAKVASSGSGGGVAVSLEFNAEGTEKFGAFTSNPANFQEIIAIVLDKKIISAPRNNLTEVVQSAVIDGMASTKEAQSLATLLNAGAIPVDLEVLQSTKIEPTLGKSALKDITRAGIIAALLIMFFMAIYYLVPGLLANLALLLYMLFCYAAYKGIGATFSLAGIAGFILSVGMAVDANILIFERMKEELRAGKTLMAAIDAGFKRAFNAIFDSNACTLITCFVLYNFGTDSVKGFAMTLGVGVVISLFTAITCTKSFLYLLVGQGFAQNPRFFALQRQLAGGSHFDFVGKRNLWFAISLIIIIPGIFFITQKGLKPNIEFRGGTEITYMLETPIKMTTEQVVSNINKQGVKLDGAMIADEGKMLILKSREYNDTILNNINVAIDKSGVANLKTASGAPIKPSTEQISGTVSKEMINNAVKSVSIASLLILLYVCIRYAIEGGWSGIKFGVAASIATLHDVLVMVGTSAALGYFLGWEISGLFLTAILTMIGFSVHDTVVIFDRIRENLRLKLRGETYPMLVNRSIIQSFARSLITSLSVIIAVLVLFLAGSATPELKHFHLILLVGLVSGTYSSIFNAAQLVVVWENFKAKQQTGKKEFEDKPIVQPGETTIRRSSNAPKITAKPASETPEAESEDGGDKGISKAPKKKRRM